MLFTFAGFAAVMGIYMSTMIAYAMAMVTVMSAYLSFYMSAFTAFVMIFLL